MKTLKLTALAVCVSAMAMAQNTNPFPTTGNVGIGTGSAQSSAVYNLHLHGATLPTLGFTNTTTGMLTGDGTRLQQNGNDFYINNLEGGTIRLGSGSNTNMAIYGATNRIWLGVVGTYATATYASTNISPSNSDNGLYVKATGSANYGISVATSLNGTGNAIQVVTNNHTVLNFAVKSTGEVYARKYTTTLNNIPDYVFDASYKLRTFDELRTFLTANKHLPNVPSAKEYTENGVDLGEMNRVLLEKVEELTLYILQLEERTKALEQKP